MGQYLNSDSEKDEESISEPQTYVPDFIHSETIKESISGTLKKPKWFRLVGQTTFTETRNIAKLIPCERLFLKFEGNNPTGTQKDRIAFALTEQAKHFGYSGITTATCGNFGAALAYAAAYFNLKDCHIYIPKGYHVPKSRLKIMEEHNSFIHFIDGTYEDAVLYSSDMAKMNNWYDANPGMNGTSETTLDAYANISIEIYKALRKAPDYVLCPVGNGSTLSGIHLGFKRLLDAKKINTLPRIIATSTTRGNPIIKSFKQHKKIIEDLKPNDVVETRVNEPLTNWHSFDGQEALNALYESNGFGEYASDSQMIHFSKVLKDEDGLIVHPASASTLAVLSKITKNNIPLKGTYVAILTGRYS